MKLRKHEKYIQNKLQKFSPEVDTQALWERVAPLKKKRRGAFFLLLAGIVLLVGFGGMYYLSNKKTNLPSKVESESMTIGLSPQSGGTDYADKDQSVKTQTAISDADAQEDIVPKNLMKTSTKSVNKENEEVFSNELNSGESKEVIEATLQSEIEVGESNIANNEAIKSARNHTVKIDNQQQNIYRDLLALEYLPMIKSELNFAAKEHILPQDPAFVAIIRPSKFAINLSVGTGYTLGAYRVSGESTGLLADLNESTSYLPELSTSMYLQYKLTSRYSIYGGIKYNRITSRINTEQTSQQMIPGTGVHTIIIGPDGEETALTGQTEIQEIAYQKSIRHTYLHSVDFELGAGMKLWSGNRFRLNANAGLLLNVCSDARGSILTIDQILYKWSSREDNPYGKFELGLAGALTMQYQVGNNIAIQLTPGISNRSVAVDLGNTSYSINLTSLTCKLGAQYQF